MRATFRSAMNVLDRPSKFRFGVLVGVQSSLAFLDLIAVLILGAVVGLTAASATGTPFTLPGVLGNFLSGYDINNTRWLAVVAGCAGIALVLKTLLSLLLTRGMFRFLARMQALVSGDLAVKVMSSGYLYVRRFRSQQLSHALTDGVVALLAGFLGSAAILVAESVLLLVLSVGLFSTEVTVAAYSLAFFSLVGVLLYVTLARYAHGLGSAVRETQVEGYRLVQESASLYRENFVTGRLPFYINEFRSQRLAAYDTRARFQIMSLISKYVFEIALVVGAVILTVVQVSSLPFAEALGIIAIFVLASSRMVPSLLRVQTALLSMRAAAGEARVLLEIVDSNIDPLQEVTIPDFALAVERTVSGSQPQKMPDPTLCLESVTFSYPDSSCPAVKSVSFEIPAGEFVVLVGPSGAGKSTLVDLILGILRPEIGRVEIGGEEPRSVVEAKPGRVAYVPQTIALMSGSVRENVAFGLPQELVDDDQVWRALKLALLDDHVRLSPALLDADVGELGSRLSGGERQRLGLARAFYSSPEFIVLDEATSALDADTEIGVTKTLMSLGPSVTKFVVAHRLTTLRYADRVLYFESGTLRAQGTVNEVRRQIPDFDRQATLFGQ